MLLTPILLSISTTLYTVDSLTISRRQSKSDPSQSGFRRLSQVEYEAQVAHPDPELIALSQKLGINCRGNFWCPWTRADGFLYIQKLLDGMELDVFDTAIFYGNSLAPFEETLSIACLLDVFDDGGFCVTLEGPIPAEGVSGKRMKEKMQQLLDHKCWACGGVPFADSNDPDEMGTLVVNWKKPARCIHKETYFNTRPVCVPEIIPTIIA